jgi:hypothetical protein
MKKWIASSVITVVACVLVPLLATCADDPPAKAGNSPPPPSTLTVPAGSTLHVRLTKTLTSKTSKTGDPFTGQVTEPITVNGQEVVPAGSLVDGHVAMVKPSGRIAGKAEMRIVLDHLVTPDDVKMNMASSLEDAHGGPCASTAGNDEGTIKGCGKSKKSAAKDAAIAGAVGAGAGATVGMGSEIECRYYGACGGPGMGTSIGYGAAIGAGTALIYNLFKHEKEIVLVQGTDLTFVVNRTVTANAASPTADSSSQ